MQVEADHFSKIIKELRLLGDPGDSLGVQGRDGPAVFVVLLDMKAVGLGGLLELLVVVVPVVAYILDAVGQVVQVGHFVQHGGRHFADGPVDRLPDRPHRRDRRAHPARLQLQGRRVKQFPELNLRVTLQPQRFVLY